jgi:ABC-type amino acid transport substrate-binding protein
MTRSVLALRCPTTFRCHLAWVAVTPADRIAKLVQGTIDLECGSTTITFGRMEQVAFSHMISVDGGSLLATVDSGLGTVKDLAASASA